MALYKDGNPVSGLNSIPRLTLAQYNTLNVKPEVWIRTDAPESYKRLSADEISYDNTDSGLTATEVQSAIDEINNSKFDKSGGTISGRTKIVVPGTTSSVGRAIFELGNNTSEGTDGNSRGLCRIYGPNQYYGEIFSDNLTDNRTLCFPNKSGTIATTDDNYYHPGDVFSTTWLQWPCFINNGATAADCYITLPKAIGSDVTNATITIGNVSNLRVNGTNYNSGMTLGGGGVNSSSGIISFFINGDFGNNGMCTGQVALNNFTVTFI